jgi:hypothetical protein
MVSLPAVLLHAASTCLMAYGYTSLSGLAISTWIEKQRGGHFQFLTVQGRVQSPQNFHQTYGISRLVVAWLTAIVSLADELGVSLQSECGWRLAEVSGQSIFKVCKLCAGSNEPSL